jgi:hypothetical protein
LGAQMGSNAFPVSACDKYCPNGDMAFAHHHGAGLSGGP